MIPPHIYTYWEPLPIPPRIQTYIDSWSKIGFEVRILSTDAGFEGAGLRTFNMSPQMRADWVRLKTIYEKGGIWLDASVLINDPKDLTDLRDAASSQNASIGGYTINSILQSDFGFPVLENWCFMAPPRSDFVKEWLTEFELALWMGFGDYIQFQKQYNLQKIVSMYGTYLTMHVCAQVVMQRRASVGQHPASYAVLRPAEETFYKLHVDCGWKPECVADADKSKYSIVKIRGCERNLTLWQRFLRLVFLP